MADAPHPLVGAWRLITSEMRAEDGGVVFPHGPDAIGYLLYSAGGFMSVAVMRAGRPVWHRAGT